MVCATKEAVELFHNGAKALSRVEHVGIRIDERKLKENIKWTAGRISELDLEMKKTEVWKKWRRRFGEKTNIESREQLGVILFDVMGYPSPGYTEGSENTKKKRHKVTEIALQNINDEFVGGYIEWQKMLKCKNTFLEGIRRETCEGYLHAIYNLNIARTFRSSADSPNFQNFPIRDKILGKLIREVFIPRKRHKLLEIDFKGIEVRVAACYNKDPVLIEYILDESKDMHRDMASQCYMIPPEEVSKEARYCGKNQFVFPEFYGDWYIECAKQLWESITKMDLKTNSGVPLKKVLARKGITELGACDPNQKPVPGTFEHHIWMVEKDFWGRRFKVYAEWKDSWFAKYQKRGWFRMYTGFVESGVMSRNDVINHPVQGAAFHCLLWSLIELQNWLIKNKMRSMIVGQIHDSILLDCHEDEVEVVYEKAKEIMTRNLLQHWKWIIVPFDIEADLAHDNWNNKHTYPEVQAA